MDGTVRSTAGGFQAMTQDVLTVLNDIPFSIPPYFALLGRAVVTLEGIALTGNPDYKIVMEVRKATTQRRPVNILFLRSLELPICMCQALAPRYFHVFWVQAYPFVARKLLAEDRPEIQKALQEVIQYLGRPQLLGASSGPALRDALTC